MMNRTLWLLVQGALVGLFVAAIREPIQSFAFNLLSIILLVIILLINRELR